MPTLLACSAGDEPLTHAATTQIDDFRLADGEVVALRVAYTLSGPCDAPTYLLLHGYTGSHHALAPHPDAADAGWAAAWAGPGCALDTRQVQVITVNLPGSSYGSSWDGADDSYASVQNMARAIRALLDQLGVDSIAGVIGYSFGGYVALQLKSDLPSRVERVLGICTAMKGRGNTEEISRLRELTDADSRYTFRVETLMRAGLREWAHDQGDDALARELVTVQKWSRQFSAQSLWRLRAAAINFDLGECPGETTLLYADSDALFPPPLSLPPNATTVSTPYGHQSLLLDPQVWTQPIGAWLAQ